MKIATTGQWGPCEARLQVKAKWQAVQWIDGPDKTGSNGVGEEDLGAKLSEDESVGKRSALQLEVQELEPERQPAPQERKKEIQEAPPGPEEGAQEAPPDPAEETQKVPLDPEETQKAPPNLEGETREAPSDPGVETKDVAGLAEGSTDLKRPVVPVRRKLTISGIFRQILSRRTWSRRVHTKGRTLPTIGWHASREGVCVVGVGFAWWERKKHTDNRGMSTSVLGWITRSITQACNKKNKQT